MQLPVLPNLDPSMPARIQAHLDDLTKPQGSLGRLESLALQLAWIAGTPRPENPCAHILTFAGDHGIARHGISAFPPEVTPQMVANMAAGGAAICVLCKQNDISHSVIDVGVAVPCEYPGVVQRNVVRGTGDPLQGPVMSRQEAEACIQAGIDQVMSIPGQGFALLGLGEMGIANSSIAALLTCAFGGLTPEEAVGPGTGIQSATLAHKLDILHQVLAKHDVNKHGVDRADGVAVLAAFGGAEFGAMAGAMLAGASRGWGVIVDGYISGAAALLAMALDPKVKDFLFWSHRSAEPGAGRLLEKLQIKPVLDLGLRLGEGTGAALAVPILRSACAILREMATFSSAGVHSGEKDAAPHA